LSEIDVGERFTDATVIEATLAEIDADARPAAAVIIALPCPRSVATPVGDTETMFSFDVDHVADVPLTGLPEESLSSTAIAMTVPESALIEVGLSVISVMSDAGVRYPGPVGSVMAEPIKQPSAPRTAPAASIACIG
jgi:hypothetical protein